MSQQEETYKRQLIDRYLSGQASENELMAFFGLLNRNELDQLIEAHMDQEIETIRQEKVLPLRRPMKWRRIAAAASILLAVSIGGYFLLHKPKPQEQIAQNQQLDIAPGHNQATLTLANGQKIVLIKGMNRRLANNIHIDSSAIVYQSDNIDNNTVAYNTLTTKKGEASPYPLILADGTKVWLNAASSITFPTKFANDRVVTVTGEAYFEVKHDVDHPFTVKAGLQTIEDIGTSFDVNSYSDEPIAKTTLIEGSVRVNHLRVLKPGQQSNYLNGKLTVTNADTEAALAWKNGAFDFSHADLETTMRQISRWYDVDVVYEGAIPAVQINGRVDRYTNASNALKIIKLLGVNYRIAGRQIIITNK